MFFVEELSGVSPQRISQIERGKARLNTVSVAQRLAVALDCVVSDIIDVDSGCDALISKYLSFGVDNAAFKKEDVLFMASVMLSGFINKKIATVLKIPPSHSGLSEKAKSVKAL